MLQLATTENACHLPEKRGETSVRNFGVPDGSIRVEITVYWIATTQTLTHKNTRKEMQYSTANTRNGQQK